MKDFDITSEFSQLYSASKLKALILLLNFVYCCQVQEAYFLSTLHKVHTQREVILAVCVYIKLLCDK